MKLSSAALELLFVLSATSVSSFSVSHNGLLSKSGKEKPCKRAGRPCPKGSVAGATTYDAHKEIGGDSFALRMSLHLSEGSIDEGPSRSKDEGARRGDDDGCNPNRHRERRKFLHAMLLSGTTPAAFGALDELSRPVPAAVAYEKSFPADLDFDGGDTTRNVASLRNERIAAQKAKTKTSMDDLSSKPLLLRTKEDVVTSAVWAGSLWLLSGSRSNPLVTPLANVLYDERDEPWLKDRNDGLFAPLPPGFLFVLGLVFLLLGVVTDRAVLFATEFDADVDLQLAGVSLIGGGALELGRIASGEKRKTRVEDDRDELLQREFAEFAERRLKPGGSLHRSDVVGAFRRFYGKYRWADNPEYPLADLEIERLLRDWNRGRGNEDMSSAGFFKGIQIDDQADVFANR